MENQITDLAKMIHAPIAKPIKTVVIREDCNKCLNEIKELKLKYHPE